MVAFTGINHLALVTRDMDATIRFWRDLLGLRMVVGMGRKGYRHYFFELSGSDMISFFEWDKVEPVPEKDHGVPVKGPFAFDHLAMGVRDRADLWELKDKLEAAGFWVSEVLDHGFIHSLYSFDPNNIAIEFCCEVPGVDIREHPVLIDRNASMVALEGFEPQKGCWPEPKPSPISERRVYPGEGRELLNFDGEE